LQKLLATARAGIRFNEHMAGDGATIFAHACQMGLEGIVSKHRERAYRPGPSKTWLKIKKRDAVQGGAVMLDYLDTALYIEDRARRTWNPADRARFVVAARKDRMLAIADAGRFITEMPKRPPAASVRAR
jgi:hypothetical protein